MSSNKGGAHRAGGGHHPRLASQWRVHAGSRAESDTPCARPAQLAKRDDGRGGGVPAAPAAATRAGTLRELRDRRARRRHTATKLRALGGHALGGGVFPLEDCPDVEYAAILQLRGPGAELNYVIRLIRLRGAPI